MVDFYSHVNREPGLGPYGDCHEWTGPRRARGYGSFGKVMATHIALELDGRKRPSIAHGALHSCDNPPCVNPAHLRWGTQKENAQDASLRLRYPNATKTHCPKGHEYTEANTVLKKRNQGWKDRHCRECDRSRKVKERAAAKERKMSDIDGQAREFLAAEYERNGYGGTAEGIRYGCSANSYLEELSIRAITAALRTRSGGVDAQDAARYRWLKANCQNVADEHGTAGQLYFGTYSAGDLDSAIDHAGKGDGNG